MQLRSASSEWSYGCIDVNELGTSVLLLPQRGWFRGSANRGAVIAHIEVRTLPLHSLALFARNLAKKWWEE